MTERNDTKQEFESAFRRLRQLPDVARARLHSRFSQALLDETFEIDTPSGPLKFVLLGRETAIRAMSVLTKQPATIRWIESFRENSVFWDVGANVGVYAMYAALRGNTRVVAFEPAAINFFLLAANCEANGLDTQVDCLLVGLSSEKAIGRLAVSQFSPAKSFSFRANQEKKHRSQQAALLMSMDQLVEEYDLACPNYIKIDVPGLTAEIIAGAARTLRRKELLELHIEIGESSIGRQIKSVLAEAGFVIAGTHVQGSVDVTFVRQKPDTGGD